ncbi:MAG: PIN domain-containing protein [Micromonosporaceae bacterium]
MRYLADTSALVRILRGEVDVRWDDVVERGLVAICDPVLTETLTIADAKRYERVERQIRDAYPWVPVPDDVWDIVRALRRELAAHSQHQGLSVADYLVAATAMRHKLVVLHEDAGFETVARVVPQLRQERVTTR